MGWIIGYELVQSFESKEGNSIVILVLYKRDDERPEENIDDSGMFLGYNG